MKMALIGTYPPRQCGIGTFTNNLAKAIVHNTDSKRISKHIMVIALNGQEQQTIQYPEEVKRTIRQNHQRDYIDAANYINYSDVEVCVLQHEFGIFGGDDGVYILQLLHRLKVPLIVTLHTVLKNPSYTQRSIVEEIGKKAARMVVMSRRAVDFLTDIYNIPRERIVLIEHGVPEFVKLSRQEAKQKNNLQGKRVFFTFGLLSRNKGIETAIHALSKVVEKYPDVLYVVLGATHPNVLKHSGEEYRDYLWRMVKNLGLQRHVYFKNEFATESLLFEYLTACDVYITPYLNESQITSGTLAYAVGSGCAVVSTPYWHAQELLEDGRGRWFDFKNSDALSEILIDLLDHEGKLVAIRKNATEYGKQIKWPRIGREYLNLLEEVKHTWVVHPKEEKPLLDLGMLPAFNLEHITRLTDGTGIIQHAKYGIPNLKDGYCLDDNSRALLMMLMAYQQYKDDESLKLMYTYLSFIHYMQRENGNFRNFLSFSRQFLDEYGSEDSYGRTIWALGYLICYPPNDAFRELGREIFFHSAKYFNQIESVRGAANSILGICYYLKNSQEDEAMVQHLKKLTLVITASYKQNLADGWGWFEKVMTYDNAIIPLALLSSFEVTGDQEVFEIATETTGFLESKTMASGYFSPVGNEGWLRKGQAMPLYDQQPLDTMAMVLLYYKFFQVTNNTDHINNLLNCYMWFLGENSLRLPLFDNETKGCCDGLEQNGVNRNQGAESTLAYWISHLTVLAAQEKEHLFQKSVPAYDMKFSGNGYGQKTMVSGNFWTMFRNIFGKSNP